MVALCLRDPRERARPRYRATLGSLACSPLTPASAAAALSTAAAASRRLGISLAVDRVTHEPVSRDGVEKLSAPETKLQVRIADLGSVVD